MKKPIFALFLAGFMSSAPAFSANTADYETALSRHAQSTARELLSTWIEKRATGLTWNYVLRVEAPKTLDAQCGYRSLVGLPDVGFNGARVEVEPVVGKRLESTFGSALNRPNAQLQLVDTKALVGGTTDQALVLLKVTPAKPKDPTLTLLMQLTSSGSMVLCDIGSDGRAESGVLYKLGNELNL